MKSASTSECHMSVFRYTYDQRYDRALEIYLRLKHKDVYQLIHKHNLFSSIEDKIVLLMDFDKEVNFTYLLWRRK